MTPDGSRSPLLLAWALVDLLQIPLVAAVLLSIRLSRPLGAPWRAVALCFGAYTGWVVLTAYVVPSSPSGLLVLVFGLLLDPRRETPPARIWALGAALAIGLFWAIPIAVTWRLRRARPRARP